MGDEQMTENQPHQENTCDAEEVPDELIAAHGNRRVLPRADPATTAMPSNPSDTDAPARIPGPPRHCTTQVRRTRELVR